MTLKTIALTGITAAALMTTPASNALTILNWDANGVGTWTPASAANNNTEAAQAANALVNWYNGGPAASMAGITFERTSPEPPVPPLPINLVAGIKDEQGPFDNIDATVYQYVVGKYGNTAYLFYIGNINDWVQLPSSLGPVGATQNGLSHELTFTATPSVPDGGTTLMLLGTSLAALAGIRRKLQF